MDLDEGRFHGMDDEAWEDLVLGLDDGGDLPPVEPPEPPRGERPPRGPGRPTPVDDQVFHPGWTAGMLALMTAMGGLQVLAISAGARGGYLAVALIAIGFATLFLVPFVVGALWFGRMRERDR